MPTAAEVMDIAHKYTYNIPLDDREDVEQDIFERAMRYECIDNGHVSERNLSYVRRIASTSVAQYFRIRKRRSMIQPESDNEYAVQSTASSFDLEREVENQLRLEQFMVEVWPHLTERERWFIAARAHDIQLPSDFAQKAKVTIHRLRLRMKNMKVNKRNRGCPSCGAPWPSRKLGQTLESEGWRRFELLVFRGSANNRATKQTTTLCRSCSSLPEKVSPFILNMASQAAIKMEALA